MAEFVDVTMPTDQSEGTESVVAQWFRAVGEAVRINDPLLEISTDKVTVEIAAPTSGVLCEILKPEAEQVSPGEVLGRIEVGGNAAAVDSPALSATGVTPSAAAAKPAPLPGGGPEDFSPAVRKLLKQHGLSAADVTGTGRGGRITAEDVEAAASKRSAPASASGIPSRMIPHSSLRRSIAHHMAQSMQTAPHVTTVFECDLTAVIADREQHQAEFMARGTKLTFTAYFVRAAVAALRAVPEVNSRWHDAGLEVFEDCNIGIGTALPAGGLIVPVIHHGQALDLLGIATRLQDLTTRARAGALTPADVQHGTFTISNHGVSGSLFAAPIIINQPQSAILGIGKLEPRVVPNPTSGVLTPTIRPRLYVTLTIDHRVLDGFQANSFLAKWVETIENV